MLITVETVTTQNFHKAFVIANSLQKKYLGGQISTGFCVFFFLFPIPLLSGEEKL